MKEYSKKDLKQLKAKSHGLNVSVMIGKNEITEGLINQVNESLDSSELIKLKISCDNQTEFKSLLNELLQKVEAVLVHKVGHVAVLYREKQD